MYPIRHYFNVLSSSRHMIRPGIVPVRRTLYRHGVYRNQPLVLNGARQWIYTRSKVTKAPVLLWIDGGPGIPELGWVERYNAMLENHFMLINWDQRGTGKSYTAVRNWSEITPSIFVDDVIALGRWLNQSLDQKVILLGHGWGSVIAMMAAQQRPELFRALVSVSPWIHTLENEILSYDLVFHGALKHRHEKVLRRLEQMGHPPYMTDSYQNIRYLHARLSMYNPHRSQIRRFDQRRFLKAGQHNLFNRLHILAGMRKSMQTLYPQLIHLNLKETLLQFNIPILFCVGRYDVHHPARVAEDYFEAIQAPQKTFIWFEHSSHSPCFQEPHKFNRVMIETVNRYAQQPRPKSRF